MILNLIIFVPSHFLGIVNSIRTGFSLTFPFVSLSWRRREDVHVSPKVFTQW